MWDLDRSRAIMYIAVNLYIQWFSKQRPNWKDSNDKQYMEKSLKFKFPPKAHTGQKARKITGLRRVISSRGSISLSFSQPLSLREEISIGAFVQRSDDLVAPKNTRLSLPLYIYLGNIYTEFNRVTKQRGKLSQSDTWLRALCSARRDAWLLFRWYIGGVHRIYVRNSRWDENSKGGGGGNIYIYIYIEDLSTESFIYSQSCNILV